jgi:hypothetical protein
VRTVHGVLVRGARRALRVLVRTGRRTHPAHLASRTRTVRTGAPAVSPLRTSTVRTPRTPRTVRTLPQSAASNHGGSTAFRE